MLNWKMCNELVAEHGGRDVRGLVDGDDDPVLKRLGEGPTACGIIASSTLSARSPRGAVDDQRDPVVISWSRNFDS